MVGVSGLISGARLIITYANWFSYCTPDFVSENHEIYRAIRITRALFPALPIRFVGDAGLDGRKMFAWVDRAAGLSAILVTIAALSFATQHPFLDI